jgi:hypothetical protein
MEEHRLNALDFLEEPSGFEKIYRTHTLVVVVTFRFRLEVMSGSRQCTGFLVSCHSKRNDGDCKSRNVVDL